MTLLNEIVEILVGGIVKFGSGLATGINGFVQGLFIGQGAEGAQTLSVFGQVVAIFGGVAIAIGITRRLFNMVATLGGRR